MFDNFMQPLFSVVESIVGELIKKGVTPLIQKYTASQKAKKTNNEIAEYVDQYHNSEVYYDDLKTYLEACNVFENLNSSFHGAELQPIVKEDFVSFNLQRFFEYNKGRTYASDKYVELRVKEVFERVYDIVRVHATYVSPYSENAAILATQRINAARIESKRFCSLSGQH